VKYVDWVERVGRAAAQEYAAPDTQRLIGVQIGRVAARLGLDGGPDQPGFTQRPEYQALVRAVGDLRRLGLADPSRSTPTLSVKLTSEGRRLATVSLREGWPQIHEQVRLDDEQLTFLQALVGLAEQQHDGYADLAEVEFRAVFEALGWTPDFDRAHDVTSVLEDQGCVDRRPTMGNIRLTPTYVGVVVATEAVQTEWQELLASLLEEWETTSVDFKRELHLKRDKEKAKFVRNVLALATTKSSGRRFLVIGFDDTTHKFAVSVDPSITHNRLEQILNAYTDPIPEIRYHTVVWETGEVGVIEVLRDPTKVPYRVARDLGNLISVGEIYVRHGTQVEQPTPGELAALEAEGQAARAR